jgi:hypothetical protein
VLLEDALTAARRHFEIVRGLSAHRSVE